MLPAHGGPARDGAEGPAAIVVDLMDEWIATSTDRFHDHHVRKVFSEALTAGMKR